EFLSMEGRKSAIENIYQQFGWMHVEEESQLLTTVERYKTPHRYSAEELTIKKAIDTGELEGQTLNTYLIATLFHKVITNQWLDECWAGGNHSILPGSRIPLFGGQLSLGMLAVSSGVSGD